MCTIALATRILEDAPIAVGANREERYDRPSIAPGLLESGPAVYGPMDLAAGGTWIAINNEGLLVALTNRDSNPTGERSRGWLVRDLARMASAEAAKAKTNELIASDRYAGFNLVLADPGDARLITWDGTIGHRSLQPGIHVVVNEGFNGAVPKSATLRSRLVAAAPRSLGEWNRRLRTVLTDHGLGVCVHGNRGGTRSSSLVARRNDGSVVWHYADGPPCEYQHRRVIDRPL